VKRPAMAESRIVGTPLMSGVPTGSTANKSPDLDTGNDKMNGSQVNIYQ